MLCKIISVVAIISHGGGVWALLGALPFSAVVGDLALILVAQWRSPTKWEVSSQLGHLLTMWEHDFPFLAVHRAPGSGGSWCGAVPCIACRMQGICSSPGGD